MIDTDYWRIEALASQLYGFSLDYRRSGTEWPKPWRAVSMFTKNERSDMRIACYGDTPGQALEELIDSVRANMCPDPAPWVGGNND